ncbi:ATP synthase F0F1 subunit delta [Leifsonia sp. Root4]|jgi:F-type H+-transporting ATPase subunit delta|uniref:F0F1 ATP synthase subunit delta n=1 Tax=Leifsonia sp. Root4 TaxID=1736525 RepID=UPI0007021E03|nr:F0F1 ATP synthase subunit delta [Leifsonia sp. Root4]KQW07753.1 ATP synthase F0F1 subunit delta [Leifsonia sp. Root4]
MGSATREALASARAALTALSGANLATGEELFAASRVIGSSSQLVQAVADPGADSAAKVALVDSVFSSLSAPVRELLRGIAVSRWSSQEDVLAAIEELGLRAIAASAPSGAAIEQELFAFGEAVAGNAELELALSNKLGDPVAKSTLVASLLGGKASAQTTAIVNQLVLQPRGRRIGELLRYAASVVADEAGFGIATVTSAGPIAPAQLQRLAAALSGSYGRELRINQVVDPAVLGGLRVQIGDDVIDGSIASRLNDVRIQLAS